MAYTQRDNSGSLFVNDRKEASTQPDYKGSITVDGRNYWLKGWKKTSQAGDVYLSLSVQPKDGVRHE